MTGTNFKYSNGKQQDDAKKSGSSTGYAAPSLPVK